MSVSLYSSRPLCAASHFTGTNDAGASSSIPVTDDPRFVGKPQLFTFEFTSGSASLVIQSKATASDAWTTVSSPVTASGTLELDLAQGSLVRVLALSASDVAVGVSLRVPAAGGGNRRLFVATYAPNGAASWSEWVLPGDATILCMDTIEVPGRGPVLGRVIRRPSGVYVEEIALTAGDS